MRNEKWEEAGMKVFWCGFLAGVLFAGILFGVISGFVAFHNRDKEIVEYAEKQIEIEALREDVINRDPAEFLEVPSVRRGR
jgi:uncharacterized protein (DUF2062 family)